MQLLKPTLYLQVVCSKNISIGPYLSCSVKSLPSLLPHIKICLQTLIIQVTCLSVVLIMSIFKQVEFKPWSSVFTVLEHFWIWSSNNGNSPAHATWLYLNYFYKLSVHVHSKKSSVQSSPPTHELVSISLCLHHCPLLHPLSDFYTCE
jgi:hypothetical protein